MTAMAIDVQDAHDSETDNSAKRRQIMDGAREVFLSGGFDGASMNDIARAAGVSKGTLYVYFDSKEQLFETLIREDRRQQAERLCGGITLSGEPRDVLYRFGRNLLDMLVRPEQLAHVRAVVAVAGKFPRIGQAFFEAGPMFGIGIVTRYLTEEAAKGTLNLPDPELAAWQFMELSHAGMLKRLLFGVVEDISSERLDTTVAAAVDMFMRAYGKETATAAAARLNPEG
ncbi:MAG: TetR/AcrR family transcriptional regulator [Ancalomicrobiaceae bacterium]|nr:TetR/AcrR family transcriptional regulator [Ancalomicrobiaceae bacterium]